MRNIEEIKFIRGDTHRFEFRFVENGEPYMLSAGDIIRLCVFKGRQKVISKPATAADQTDDGLITVVFRPEDTSNLRAGIYEYERELITSNGRVTTIPRMPFVIFEDLITPENRGIDQPSPSEPDARLSAGIVLYNNKDSGLDADNLQEAVDELNGKIRDIKISEPIKSHTQLDNRDAADQHPISAITGLQEQLDGMKTPVVTKFYDKTTAKNNMPASFILNYNEPIDSTDYPEITVEIHTASTEAKIAAFQKRSDGKLLAKEIQTVAAVDEVVTAKFAGGFPDMVIAVIGGCYASQTTTGEHYYATLGATDFSVGSIVSIWQSSSQYYDIYARIYATTLSNDHVLNSPYVLTVSPYGDKQFTTLGAALEQTLTMDRATAPVTILVYPGVYEEVNSIPEGHYISIIGTNRSDCILIDRTGFYENSPLKITGNFTLRNLTIAATHEHTENFTENRPDDYRIGSYGLHLDDSAYTDESKKVAYIEDCTIISEQNAAVGVGMQKNCSVIFRNCIMVNNTPDRMYELYSRPGFAGGLLVHRANLSEPTPQRLVLDNCRIKSRKGYGIQFGGFSEEKHGMTLSCYNNIVYSEERGRTGVVYIYTSDGVSSIELTPDSFGNNVDELNA